MHRLFKNLPNIFSSLTITFTLILALSVCSFILTGIFTGIPTIFDIRPYFIMTESMEPAIHRYSLVLTVPAETSDLNQGDIAVYLAGGTPAFGFHVIHRIVNITEEGFIFKGDHNPHADPEAVPPERVMYRVILGNVIF